MNRAKNQEKPGGRSSAISRRSFLARTGAAVDAVLGKGQTSTSFDYSAPLTEAVLLGNIASRFPNTTLEWDAAKLKIKNVREANGYIRRRYRKGWRVKGL
jgi:hypothetical protein